jgi:hypothetical protein
MVKRLRDDRSPRVCKLTVIRLEIEEHRIQPPSRFAGFNDGGITFGKSGFTERPSGLAGCLKVLSDGLETNPDFTARIAREDLKRVVKGHSATRELSQLMKKLLPLPEVQGGHGRNS